MIVCMRSDLVRTVTQVKAVGALNTDFNTLVCSGLQRGGYFVTQPGLGGLNDCVHAFRSGPDGDAGQSGWCPQYGLQHSCMLWLAARRLLRNPARPGGSE